MLLNSPGQPEAVLNSTNQFCMIYLFGSILLTAYLILAFKVLEKFKLGIFQSIVFNYITCTIVGSLMSGNFAVISANIKAPWFAWACFMGLLFVALFNLVGITTQKISAAVSAVSYKVSLIIPAICSIYLYNETLTFLQWLGIILALAAVILTCWPKVIKNNSKIVEPYLLVLLPAFLFFGSGIQDTLIKYTEQAFLNDTNKDAFLGCAFASASLIGSIALSVRLVRRQQVFNWKNILAGIAIGVPNYFSIWCLVKYLQVSPLPSSAIIPINNLGIVLCSVLAAWLIFKEKLSVKNAAGIALSLVAIFLMALGGLL